MHNTPPPKKSDKCALLDPTGLPSVVSKDVFHRRSFNSVNTDFDEPHTTVDNLSVVDVRGKIPVAPLTFSVRNSNVFFFFFAAAAAAASSFCVSQCCCVRDASWKSAEYKNEVSQLRTQARQQE